MTLCCSGFFFILDEVFSVNTTCLVKTMVYARIVVNPLFHMIFQFPQPCFGSLFIRADAYDSETLAVRNTFGAMFMMTTLWTCTDVYLSVCCIFTGSVRIQKGDVISGCFMSQFYSGVNIAVMVKEMIEVLFRLGPLHVNVVYETKPGKWLVGCRLYD